MTKKDYELIAKTIAKAHKEQLGRTKNMPREHPERHNAYGQQRALEQLATDLSAQYRELNPLFSSYKFMNMAINNNY